MSGDGRIIELRTSPHLKGGVTTRSIMFNVVVALLPIALYSFWLFGISAVALVSVCTATAVLTEHLLCVWAKKPTTVNDFSAVITGLLLGLTLPPGLPLWMGFVGGVLSIALGKALFGGLGYNPFNPALVARAFLQATFPVAITTWTPPMVASRFSEFIPSTLALPFMKAAPVREYIAAANIDGFTGATPLSLMKFDHVQTAPLDLFFGATAGSAGETSSLLIILCGLYLVARKMMNWRIPAGMILAGAILSGVIHFFRPETTPTPLFTIFSGGFMLGAMFMASDMVASPTTSKGVWIYGAFIGAMTVVIRQWGGLPEGVMYAILLGNAVSPLIEQVTQNRIYGARKRPAKESA